MPTDLENKTGFITLEILIAFSVIILSLSAVAALIFSSQNIALNSQLNSEAVLIARDLLESAEADAAQDFNLLNSTATTTEGIYRKTLNVEQIDFYTKIVSSSVEWIANNKKQTVGLTTLVANREGFMTADTCNSSLKGDWKNPKTVNFDFAELVQDTGTAYPITGIDAYQGKLYVVTNNSSVNKENFFVFDIKNPQLPVLTGKIDNDLINNTGINALTIFGHYAYIASASSFSRGQLQIIDLSIAPPKVIVTYKIPSVIVSGSGTQGVGKSIYYKNGIVYLGLTKTVAGPELNIIDVTDVYHPAWKGGAVIGNTVNAISVKGNFAYVASPNVKDLLVYDIRPENFSQNMPPFGMGFNGTNGLHGKSLALVGNTIYLGRTFGTNEFYILNASNPEIITELGHKDIGNGNNTSVNGLIVKDYLAFLLAGNQLQFWNLLNPSNVSQWTSFVALSVSGEVMDCEGEYIYVAAVPSNNFSSILILFPGS